MKLISLFTTILLMTTGCQDSAEIFESTNESSNPSIAVSTWKQIESDQLKLFRHSEFPFYKSENVVLDNSVEFRIFAPEDLLLEISETYKKFIQSAHAMMSQKWGEEFADDVIDHFLERKKRDILLFSKTRMSL